MTSTQIEVKDYRYFAGNQWRKATDDQFFEVHEPYSGQLFARVAAGSRADARAAVMPQPKRSQRGPIPRRPKELLSS